MNDMQDEFEEMQDGFREEQSEEFANLKRDLDDSAKNVRLLQFKLRKTEKRADGAEAEKKELEMRLSSMKNVDKITQLEEELSRLKGENERLLKGKKDLSLSPRLGMKTKKSPVLTKAPSGEVRA
jgi:chromosome segregation ATPase